MKVCDGSDTLWIDGGQAESRTPDVKVEHVLGDCAAFSKFGVAMRALQSIRIDLDAEPVSDCPECQANSFTGFEALVWKESDVFKLEIVDGA